MILSFRHHFYFSSAGFPAAGPSRSGMWREFLSGLPVKGISLHTSVFPVVLTVAHRNLIVTYS